MRASPNHKPKGIKIAQHITAPFYMIYRVSPRMNLVAAMIALALKLQPLFGIEVQTFNALESGLIILNVRGIPARRWMFRLRGVNRRTSLRADDPAETSWAGIGGARTGRVCLAPHQCITATRNSSSPRGTAWSPQERGTGKLRGQAWGSIHKDNITKQQNENMFTHFRTSYPLEDTKYIAVIYQNITNWHTQNLASHHVNIA